jgi:hypothetical protein
MKDDNKYFMIMDENKVSEMIMQYPFNYFEIKILLSTIVTQSIVVVRVAHHAGGTLGIPGDRSLCTSGD